MAAREEFKEWYSDQMWGNESWEDGLRIAWQACDELNKARIAELEAKLARLTNKPDLFLPSLVRFTRKPRRFKWS